jgi:hypothetical protein
MQKIRSTPGLYMLWAILAFSLVASCANRPHVVGRWQETGKTATLELLNDGTFTAVDNEGMAVSGNYTLFKDGTITFEVTRQGSSPDIVNAVVTVQGDELMVVFSHGKEVGRYKRRQ